MMLRSKNKDFKPWLQLLKLIRESLAKGHRKFLVASLFVHLLVVLVISWSWSATEAVKTYTIPANVEARVLSQAEIESLPYKMKEKELEALRKQKLLEEKRKAELAKKKALEEKRKKEAANKKKEQAKKEAEKKRLLAIKKKQEEAAKKKEELERLKKLKELEAAQQAAKQKEAQKQKEIEQQAELEKLAELAKQREQAIREQRLAERLEAIKDLKAGSDQPAEAMDMDERTRYLSIIKSRIESRWFVPPNSSGQVVVLRIQLLPTGELSSVKIIESSGNAALDQSALAAVNAVGRFEVPKESAFFEKYFRSFQMSFKPPE